MGMSRFGGRVASSVAVRAVGIGKTYGKTIALKDVSLEVEWGSVMGLIGANGAGKTTLLRILLSTLRADGGTVTYFSRSTPPRSQSDGIGAQVDSLGLDKGMTARAVWSYFQHVYSVSAKRSATLVERTDVSDLFPKRIKSMSTGERRRFDIALALINDPEFLIFDEPLNGLDPDAIDWFADLVMELRDQGKAILLSSHILSELDRIADAVTVIQHGVVSFSGDISEAGDVERAYRHGSAVLA